MLSGYCPEDGRHDKSRDNAPAGVYLKKRATYATFGMYETYQNSLYTTDPIPLL